MSDGRSRPHPLSVREFNRPQSGGPSSTTYRLPHGHGGPDGAEPQPMTPPTVVEPVGEEAPLQQEAITGNRRVLKAVLRRLPQELHEQVITQRHLRIVATGDRKVVEAVMAKLPEELRPVARQQRQAYRQQLVAQRPVRQSKKDGARDRRRQDKLDRIQHGH